MRRKYFLPIVALALLVAVAPLASAQIVDRINDRDVKHSLTRLEQHSDAFRKSLDRALDRSEIDHTSLENGINQYVKDFERATDALEKDFSHHDAAPGLVTEVLRRAMSIDEFMRLNRLTPEAQRDWSLIRGDLDILATAYSVEWTWTGEPVATRVSDDEVKVLLGRIEKQADAFKSSLDGALDRSSYNGTSAEDEINGYVGAFEHATDEWKSHFGDRSTASRDATEVLRRAQSIDVFMATHELNPETHDRWMALRATLDDLARAYSVTWNW
jgi:hypothetical protein